MRLIHAAANVLDGTVAAARESLVGAIADSEVSQMTTLAALARRRFAQLDGDGDDAELVKRGLVDPVRFARMFATWPE